MSKISRKELEVQYADALLALHLVTEHRLDALIIGHLRRRAEEFLRRFRADEDLLLQIGEDGKFVAPRAEYRRYPSDDEPPR